MIPSNQAPVKRVPTSGKFRIGRALLTVNILLFIGLKICYGTRPDACAAITVFPAWIWLVPGLTLTALGYRRNGKRTFLIVVAVWLFFLLSETEEPWSLLRAMPLRTTKSRGETLRVVTLNCAIGSPLAAAEVAAHRPDIVLLQESPNRAEVEELGRRLFGAKAGVVHGVDASMVVRGRVIPAELPIAQRGYFVQAKVRFASGREIEIIGARLVPAVFRLDLWSPDCWREQAENRRIRQKQLRAIARRIETTSVPVIVGGDFNAPQGDAVFRLLEPKLHDAFREGGRGWGNTILNDYPVLRIDQIWVSKAFRSHAVVAVKTQNSDHRMVICDLILEEEALTRKER